VRISISTSSGWLKRDQSPDIGDLNLREKSNGVRAGADHKVAIPWEAEISFCFRFHNCIIALVLMFAALQYAGYRRPSPVLTAPNPLVRRFVAE
jgi:hypothetical protein